MENRSIGQEERKELALYQPAAVARHTSLDEAGYASLSPEEVRRLIEFFRLLDRWDHEEVVQ